MDFRETAFQDYFQSDVYSETPTVSSRRSVGQNSSSPANAIIEGLPADVRRVVEPSLKLVELRKEEFICHEGDRLEYVFFPVTAVVSEFKMLEDGRMVEITVTGKEGAVGLSSVFSQERESPNYTQVSQAGTALRIDAVTFEKLIKSNDRLRHGLNSYLSSYIRQISQKALCNMYHSVRERLCTWLLMVQDRSGRSKLDVTHEQIARTLGVYRPSVTCIAQELRDLKLIDYSRGGISIRNRSKVEDSACSCYLELGTA